MGIHLETPQELDHIRRFGCHIVLIFLRFGSGAPSECIMGESHGFARLESTPVDLLEVLYVDCRVVFMEAKERLIT